MTRRVVVCGIPRSGTTLVWQVLSKVCPDPISKTHPAVWQPDGSSLAVVTIRDPRDVAASLYRVRLSRGGPGVEGPEGLNSELEQLALHFLAVPAIRKEPHLLLRYEEFFWDMMVLWDAIEQTFGWGVSLGERMRIERLFSLDANRERAARLSNFNEIGEHHIHGDHIGLALPGSWRQTLPEWAWDRVKKVCDPIAAMWGYGADP